MPYFILHVSPLLLCRIPMVKRKLAAIAALSGSTTDGTRAVTSGIPRRASTWASNVQMDSFAGKEYGKLVVPRSRSSHGKIGA